MEAVIDLHTENKQAAATQQGVTLSYLFFTFFKIGIVSFGGHMALIAVVQRIMVDKDRSIENEQVLNSISIASLLPGPLAVNVVGQIGYRLKNGMGALISTIGIILPAFILMCGLSWAYFSHQQFIGSNGIMAYVTGAVCAIIVATCLQLFKKELSGNTTKIIMFAVALAVLIYSGNYLVTVALLLAGAVTGALLQVQEKGANTTSAAVQDNAGIGIFNKTVLAVLLLNQALFFTNTIRYLNTGYIKLILLFSGISLSLFGGGYVMIPLMESLFVKELHWLSNKEFVDAIAFSQATPGPILISATFIGYKLAGFFGALLATAAIFAPSVFLTIMVSKIVSRHQANKTVKNVLAGIKTVVVALIIVSAYRVTANQPINALFIAVVAACFILNYKYKVSPVYLILGAILTGTINHLL